MSPRAGKVSKKVKELKVPDEMFGINKKKEKPMKRHNYCYKCNRYYGRGSYIDKLWHKEFCDK
ncbi:hypothetical protein LCGC14_0586410 [marine sediment metagenome]|uniref:Uncharacterized protein n=1 Tax=marine sediment metagenome TaxID=412755 RepID=A0A0F9REW1_9ZZZZ